MNNEASENCCFIREEVKLGVYLQFYVFATATPVQSKY